MKKVLYILGGIVLLILLLIGISALSNLSLPEKSENAAVLNTLEKNRIAESNHLRTEFGNDVFPGWGDVEIPVIVYNESYAYLVNISEEPQPGWSKVLDSQIEGTSWDAVVDDEFEGSTYFRQEITDQATPQNFTVKVGEVWAATMFTNEYAAVEFYAGFQDDVPGFLRPILPYRLIWKILMPLSESYVQGLAHEAFHAFQGMAVPERLEKAEKVASHEGDYPWENDLISDLWKQESTYLYQAVNASDEAEARMFAQKFLNTREERRNLPGITPRDIYYEQQREWLEGMAKYAELQIGLLASQSGDYSAITGIQDDPGFRSYKRQENYFNNQLKSVKQWGSQTGETRFYYTGMAQAVLLDHLMPGWKDKLFEEGVYLEDLLAKVILGE